MILIPPGEEKLIRKSPAEKIFQWGKQNGKGSILKKD